MRRFEYEKDTSSKFWEVALNKSELQLRWGRIGTAGQAKTKIYGSRDKAQAEHDRAVAEKLKEGYREVKGGGGSVSRKTSSAGAAGKATRGASTARPTSSGRTGADIVKLLDKLQK